MISYLKGKLIEKGVDHLVVMVGGLGLEVHAPAGTMEKSPPVGSEVAFHTYLHLRDDAVQLYGFDSPRARRTFMKLMKVSGFGPQKALSVLSVFSPEGFEEIIRRSDDETLTRIPGVGRKSAQRLILEMADKIEASREEVPGISEEARFAFREAVEALERLGYTRAESQLALEDFEFGDDTPVEEILQYALKNMDRAKGGTGGKG